MIGLRDPLCRVGAIAVLLLPFTATADIVHLDDVIIDGSSCVGIDCVNGENFGFDAIRLKENNIRLHFDDTSTSAGFPNNDWRIVINDSSNGGGNYFAIEDATAGRIPFRIEAGAAANSLYVEDGGRVGFGTSTPVQKLHAADGNSPGLRLEQNGSSGFTPQTWDVSGNEANFFIRDATNGSTLPFRIRPGAPTSSIDIASNGDVGIGTASPTRKLHVFGDALVADVDRIPSLRLERTGDEPQAWDVGGNDSNFSIRDVTNSDLTNPDPDLVTDIRPFIIRPGAPTSSIDIAANGNVGIGTDAPTEKLHVVGNVLVTGDLELGSSRTYKQHIRPLSTAEAFTALQGLEPVKYAYKRNPDEEMLGFIAEDVPDLLAKNGRKSLSPMDFNAMLTKIVQNQQETIKQLSKRIAVLENRIKPSLLR